ncbi:DUF6479 family protein [Streptomyces sp. NPDC020801]|uniref:DUF6479 family protein n=1 Tax=unclassified Streptomyces TaxID=2593676 RepID=UPI0037B3F867
METSRYEAAAASSVVGVVIVIVGGLVIAGALIWAVRLGINVKQREPGIPGTGEPPTLPQSGPVRETRQRGEPDEVPRAEETGRRLAPHDLSPSGGGRGEDQARPRWDEGSSGSFGSGGAGGK